MSTELLRRTLLDFYQKSYVFIGIFDRQISSAINRNNNIKQKKEKLCLYIELNRITNNLIDR